MTRPLKVGCVQYCAQANTPRNLRKIEKLVSQAAADGANLVCLPEYATCYGASRGRLQVGAEVEDRHEGLAALMALASSEEIWLLIGSIGIKRDDGLISNRSYLIDDTGDVIARYDKLHLFDVDLEGGESYRESDLIKAGDKAVVADTPFGRVGLTICYDIRFPQLYRTLAKAGADIIFAPAAFTRKTGRAHWHALITTRAIETGAYLVAPCQCGDNRGKLARYGHSLIVDPWGESLADAGEEPGVITAELDLAKVETARKAIPALQHDRLFEISVMTKGDAEIEGSKLSPTSS